MLTGEMRPANPVTANVMWWWRAALKLWAACSVTACAATASAHPPRMVELGRFTWRIGGEHHTVQVDQGATALHLSVSTYELCQVIVQEAREEVTPDGTVHQSRPEHRQDGSLQRCYERPPTARVELTLRAKGIRHKLGSTSSDGQLSVQLTDLDQLLQERALTAGETADLLVNGNKAGELPLLQILARPSLGEAVVAECEQVLRQTAISESEFEHLLASLFTLHMRGVVDPRADSCRQQLHARMHRAEEAVVHYQQELARAQELLASMQQSGNAAAVPQHVRESVRRRQTDKPTVQWATEHLPTPSTALCASIAKGAGAAVGFLVTKGTPGLAVAIISALWGDRLQSWFVETCAKTHASRVAPWEQVDRPFSTASTHPAWHHPASSTCSPSPSTRWGSPAVHADDGSS
jgi:hypothetical protein